MPPKVTEQPKQGTQQTLDTSNKNKGQAFNELYPTMKWRLEQAYMLTQQIKTFNWQLFKDITWTVKDEKGTDRLMAMADMLPSSELSNLMLAQSDRCNAFAVKVWLENPYAKPGEQAGKHLTRSEWQTLCKQLEIEISKVEDQTNKIKADTNTTFADIDKAFGVPSSTNASYASAFQSKHASYTALLDDTLQHLEQAKLLASEIRQLEIDPSTLNVP